MTARQFFKLPLLLCLALNGRTQEPAFFTSGILDGAKQAVRYEQKPGFFHYVIPCKQYISDGRFETEVALCWPVNAIRLRMVDGKLDVSPAFQAVLTVSAAQFRLIPLNQKDMELRLNNPAAQTEFSFKPGANTAFVGSKSIGYKFGFANVCISQCTPGANPLDPSKVTQLNTEFSNVSESLKAFDSVYSRMRAMALRVRFSVDPANQPTVLDNHAARALYGALNHRLAAVCPDPAKTCIQKYEAYQACQNGPSPATCAEPPLCTAICTLPPEVYGTLQAGVCESSSHDSATLFPFWKEVFEREAAERAAQPADLSDKAACNALTVPPAVGGLAGMAGAATPPGWGSLAGMSGGANAITDVPSLRPPDESCSASHIYKRVKSADVARTCQARGMSAGGGTPGGAVVGGVLTPYGQHNYSAPPMKLAVTSAAMASKLLSSSPPIYPTLAIAARVQGTVVLQATISKTGTVVNLRVISGPPLLLNAALEAVKTWTYSPFLLANNPVEIETTVNVAFNLAGPVPPKQP
jgi:TonB family protein